MIVDFDNPVSMKYSQITAESWQPAIARGLISEIILWQGITEKTLHKHKNKYNWQRSLAGIDGGVNNKNSMTPSEMAGMCSHYELMKLQSETTERFYIMEHDAWLLNVDQFEICQEFIFDHDIAWANVGLYMSCYSYNRRAAHWMYHMLTQKEFPINGGPYGVAERLYKTYASRILRKHSYNNKEFQFMTHDFSLSKIVPGCSASECTSVYNNGTPPPVFGFPNPSTQVWSEKLGITQDHANYMANPKTQRGSFYKIIP